MSGGPANFVVDEGSDANGMVPRAGRCGLAPLLAILAALADGGERSRRGANGGALVHRKYSWPPPPGLSVHGSLR